ncbi:hypothetical protein M8494_16570 [Serratia ureilytica]
MQTARKTTRTLQLFLTLVAVISLVVGGIGVMNIMLVSVTERTREIGIPHGGGRPFRRRVAAVLIEAVLVCTVGGAGDYARRSPSAWRCNWYCRAGGSASRQRRC